MLAGKFYGTFSYSNSVHPLAKVHEGRSNYALLYSRIALQKVGAKALIFFKHHTRLRIPAKDNVRRSVQQQKHQEVTLASGVWS